MYLPQGILHGILTPYPWYIKPLACGILTPLPMVYRTHHLNSSKTTMKY